MDAAVREQKPLVRKEKISRRKLFRWTAIVLILLVAAIFGYRYWRHSELYVSTDDAYLNAHTVEIAAQIGGQIVRVYVRDNQQVKAGDPLFDIDPQPYRLALDKAQAQLRLAEQSVAQQSAAVAAAEAQVAQRQAELQNAQSNNQRQQQLVRQGFLSKQGAEASRTQARTAAAALHAAQANLEQARSALGTTGENNASVKAAQAAVNQAQLDLEHTHVTAPTQGSVANLSLRPGNTVQAGAPLFALISNQEYWADANFKETELERVRPGAPATVTVDMYPDHPFHGVVESVSGGAGTAFSLLPPQNATGNWVKVTQRVPVRVRITDPDPTYPLRIGTTATVEVKANNSS
ncbi:MAG TPA: HlyD family secretion protein [Noviherbaspirillum sp.]|uniref:HlyD family secretion protein n=1 Tax=Noviherbaspirillum sp. TaxID=1926288 RepID=UPI002B4649FA|nr:HlyD family secretion protein [Noviherbaspirillum sp.]HJV85225.1 HlyD family secretion protein [Noviherbaspirillum sp.]